MPMSTKLIPREEEKHKLAFTMVVISFGISIVWLLAWLLLTPFGLEVPEFSAAESTIFTSPFLGLLFAEKWKEGKERSNEIKQNVLDAAKTAKEIGENSASVTEK